MTSQPRFPASAPEGVALSQLFVQALSAFLERYIAAEHACAPPIQDARYAPVPSFSEHRPPAAIYTCPECQQMWSRV